VDVWPVHQLVTPDRVMFGYEKLTDICLYRTVITCSFKLPPTSGRRTNLSDSGNTYHAISSAADDYSWLRPTDRKHVTAWRHSVISDIAVASWEDLMCTHAWVGRETPVIYEVTRDQYSSLFTIMLADKQYHPFNNRPWTHNIRGVSKKQQLTWFVCHNFSKWRPILKILSPT